MRIGFAFELRLCDAGICNFGNGENVMKKMTVGLVVFLFLAAAARGADPCTPATHQEFQAVDGSGAGTYSVSGKVILEGIVLNKPGDMVDPTADYQQIPTDMGGEWQIFIQGQGEDHAGTAVYMGQNYELLSWIDIGGSYDDVNWISEMERLNSEQFSPGDLVCVTGYYLFYKGKTNVNERHSNVDSNDFTIEVLEHGVGLPRPEVVELGELKDGDDEFIFDSSRQSGCEHYQGMLVRINDVSFSDANGWGPDGVVTVTDGVKTFAVKLGLGRVFMLGLIIFRKHSTLSGYLIRKARAGRLTVQAVIVCGLWIMTGTV